MQGNSAPMSGCTQKVLSCIEVGFTSQTTLSSVMTWCMCTMEPQSQDTLDDGRCWNQCHGITGGQGCPGMSPRLSQGVMHCRHDNNPPHESFVESSSRARMSYHNHPKSHLHSIF